MVTEIPYSHEINALEKRFDSWTESDQGAPAPRAPVTKLPSARDVAKNLPPEVAQFSVRIEVLEIIPISFEENQFVVW